MDKTDILKTLNTLLKIEKYKSIDSHYNWLQVDNETKKIIKIWFAVDATTYIIEKAITEKVNMLITHHWILRWKEQPLIETYYKRIKKLIIWDIALLSYHLPLDAHPEIWNNISIINNIVNSIWLLKEDYTINDFFSIKWENIWYKISFRKWQNITVIKKILKNIGLNENYYIYNNEILKNIGIVTWAWWSIIKDYSLMSEIDLFITWEWTHDTITYGKESWFNFIFWWHYETERFWLLELEKIIKWLNIETVFLDEKY